MRAADGDPAEGRRRGAGALRACGPLLAAPLLLAAEGGRALAWFLAGAGAAGVILWAQLRAERAERDAELARRRKSDEKFVKLYQLNPDGVALTRVSDGIVSDVNDSFCAMSGFARHEVVGHSTLELGLWANVDHRAQVMETLRRDGWVRNFASQLRTRDGRLVDCLFSARVIEVDGIPCLLSIMRDVSDRKSLEAQLLQAQKLEAVGRLAGGVAHDFNNLVTAIAGYGALLRESLPEGDARREDADEILRAAGRSSELTRQLLGFARRQIVRPRVVDLNAAVLGMQKLLRSLIGERVELVTRVGSATLAFRIDPGQLEQVVANLAINARDAMPEGGVLTLETAHEGGEVLLRVRDTGAGIPAEALPHIFEPFFTTKPAGAGTGLGLATSYGIITQAGGRIDVESAPGQGTCFTLRFPRTDAAAAALDEDAPDDALPRGHERVLVVEDEPQVRRLCERTLAGLGYRVLAAETGAEALAAAARHADPLDLLLSDVVLPDRAGTEVARELAAARPGLAVLLMSGHTDDAAVRDGSALGDFLPKPFSAAQLARRVRETLDGVAGGRA